MANYRDVMESTDSKFTEVLSKTTIPQWVVFKLLDNDKQKEVYQVKKSNELIHTLSDGIDVIIILNEQIFDDLEEEQKEVLLFEALHGIVVNDNDKISIEKKDFTSYTSILEKFGSDEIIRLNESIKSLFDKKEEDGISNTDN